MRRAAIRSAVASAAAVLVLMGVAALILIYSGVYDIAASSPHLAPVRWALETTMERSVREHADAVAPGPAADSALVASGFRHFDAMCVTCHGAPGRERSEIGQGLLPEPPPLSEAVARWSDEELFWIAKHGIKMTGMPAFGTTHDDETLWSIVAFVRLLPEMSPSQYDAFSDALVRGSGDGDGHAHEH